MSPEPQQQPPSEATAPVEQPSAETSSLEGKKAEQEELPDISKVKLEDKEGTRKDHEEQVASAVPVVATKEEDRIAKDATQAEARDGGLSQEMDGQTSTKQLSPVEPSSTKTVVPSPPASPPPTAQTSTTEPNVDSPEPPPPPPKDEKYVSKAQGLGLNVDTDPEKTAMAQDESEGKGKEPVNEEVDDSQSEIASIMEQFGDGKNGPGEDEIMSPRLEIAQPMFGSPQQQHPPRQSSLEPLRSGSPDSLKKINSAITSPPPRTSSLAPGSPVISLKQQSLGTSDPPDTPLTPQQTKNLPPPPQPDPEPDLPFDFHRFLEQLRHRTADPVAKYLRSFLLEFAKKQWMVHEQVKIISDFLDFITKKMAQCEIWRTVSDAEFDNAREGMEKLVMNRLYSQTFSPAIPPPEPVSSSRSKRRAEDPSRPGRRGQHQEDVERDEVLAQKMRIYGWVKEEHLDIAPIGDKGRKFMDLAQKELLKIRSYRAPRDKVICVLNCCKVIFGFLRNNQSDQSADSFIPLLIYVVLHAKPDHLVSNVQYILRFRNQDKLGGEAGYYISSLMGAIQFVENLDRTTLTISDEDFEKNVEASVSAIAEKHSAENLAPPPLPGNKPPPSPRLQPSEKSALSRPEVTPRNSLDAEQSSPRRQGSQRNGAKSDDEGEENAALSVLRTIQRPLSSIGRIFGDDTPTTGPATPSRTPTAEPSKKLTAEESAARQASAEAKQARDISAREEKNLVDTLSGMFPALDRDVLADVVRANEGRVGKAVDACLAMSAGA